MGGNITQALKEIGKGLDGGLAWHVRFLSGKCLMGSKTERTS
jgi:hypothetical protein